MIISCVSISRTSQSPRCPYFTVYQIVRLHPPSFRSPPNHTTVMEGGFSTEIWQRFPCNNDVRAKLDCDCNILVLCIVQGV